MTMINYNPEKIKSDILEKVLIRIDYEGVSEMEPLIIKLKPVWFNYFGSYVKVSKNNYNINVTDDALQCKTINIPDPEKQIIHRFTKCKVGNSNTYMDMNEKFAYIDIDARSNYCGALEYIQIVAKYVHELLKFDPFIKLTRIAIRKINKKDIDLEANPDTIMRMPMSTVYDNGNNVTLKSNYSNILLLRDVDSIVNVTRSVAMLRKNNGVLARQVILDMDIYKQGENQIGIGNNSSINDIVSVFRDKLNKPLFLLFVSTFKDDFIQTFYKP